MKNAAKLVLTGGSVLLLAIIAVAGSGVNKNAPVLKLHKPAISRLADGSVPIPPPPTGTGLSIVAPSNTLFADGSVPIPPPPTGTGLLLGAIGSVKS